MPRLLSLPPESGITCQFCRPPAGYPPVPARWFVYADDAGPQRQNAHAVCWRHGVRIVGEFWSLDYPIEVDGKPAEPPALLARVKEP